MVSIRRRKRKKADRYVVDYRDAAGIRRLETFRTKGEAQTVAAQRQLSSQHAGSAPSVNIHITVKEYAARWLEQLALAVKPTTRGLYTSIVNTHVVPALGWMKLRRLTAQRIRDLLADKLKTGALAPGTVRNLRVTITAMLSAAVDDHVLDRNPAAGLGRKLRRLQQLTKPKQGVKALTVEQLAKFLETARTRYPKYYPLFFVMARTGLRLGEALALEWNQVDLHGRELWVRQTLTPGRSDALETRLDTPKSNRERRVDLNVQACCVLEDLRRVSLAESLAAGSPSSLRFVFHAGGQPLAAHHVRAAFTRVLHTAELPEHFTPHALRHSYAIHLLQRNTPIVYVKEQLGHSSITVTVDTYGRWLPTGDKRYVDALDQPENVLEKQRKERAASARARRSPKPSGDQTVTNFPIAATNRQNQAHSDECPPRVFIPSSIGYASPAFVARHAAGTAEQSRRATRYARPAFHGGENAGAEPQLLVRLLLRSTYLCPLSFAGPERLTVRWGNRPVGSSPFGVR